MTGLNIAGYAIPEPPPPPDALLYAAKGGPNTSSDLYSLDSVTAVASSIGASGFALTGIAIRPSDGVMFGMTSNNSGANPRSIITINPATGAGTLVGSVGLASPLGDIAFRSDDVLFGFNTGTRRCYTVDTTTGAATQVSTTPVVPPSGFGFGCVFDGADVLYCFPGQGDVPYYTVDPATGTPTTEVTMSSPFGSMMIVAASFDADGVLWATVYDGAGTDCHLVTVDLATGVVTDIAAADDYLDALAWGVP